VSYAASEHGNVVERADELIAQAEDDTVTPSKGKARQEEGSPSPGSESSSSEHDSAGDESDEEESGNMEYTLKDRQDVRITNYISFLLFLRN
jgi:hypothetical protein